MIGNNFSSRLQCKSTHRYSLDGLHSLREELCFWISFKNIHFKLQMSCFYFLLHTEWVNRITYCSVVAWLNSWVRRRQRYFTSAQHLAAIRQSWQKRYLKALQTQTKMSRQKYLWWPLVRLSQYTTTNTSCRAAIHDYFHSQSNILSIKMWKMSVYNFQESKVTPKDIVYYREWQREH